jgi:glycosyltransferase involved in cell wall biosynthesis
MQSNTSAATKSRVEMPSPWANPASLSPGAGKTAEAHRGVRVLHFYKSARPDSVGGVEKVIDEIARGSVRHGVATDVLALSRDATAPSMELDGYGLHRARLDFQIASTGFSASAFRRFAELARRADVIHYHFPWPFMDAVHFATGVRKPCVVTYHADVVRQKKLLKLYRPLRNAFLRSVDRIVATSPNYTRSSESLQAHLHKVSVIPIGVDKASYPQPDAGRVAQWRARFPHGFFLFVGVLRYYKGLHILLEAARGTRFPIVIVGSGPMERQLKQQARTLGVDNVHFVGFLPDEEKVALLQECRALVFPSHVRSEAFGVSLVEAAMFGKPMISAEIGTGTTYVNLAGQTGTVVPPNDPQALREAMCHLWDDPEAAQAMGREAERRYWKHFTASDMVDSYVRVYRELATTS